MNDFSLSAPELRTVCVGGFAVDTARFGHGTRPLVILPGASLFPVTRSAEAVAAAFADFCGDFTLYLVDPPRPILPGLGIRQMAAVTASALDALGVGPADVLGCSMGGMLALCLIADRPDRVRRAVIASSMARNNAVSRATISEWKRLAEAGNVRGLNRSFAARVYSPEYRALYRAAFDAQEELGGPDELRRFAAIADALLNFDVLGSLTAFTGPDGSPRVLAVGSRRDGVVSGEASAEIAAALGADLFIYDGFSHAAYDEAPDFRARVRSFLLSVGRQGRSARADSQPGCPGGQSALNAPAVEVRLGE